MSTIVKGSLSNDQQEAVKSVAAKYVITDMDLAEDMAILLRAGGAGLVTRAVKSRLVAKLRKENADAAAALDARWKMLYKMARTRLFKRLSRAVRENFEEGLDRVMALLRSAYVKEDTTKCLQCPMMDKCPRGRFYAKISAADGTPLPNCPRYKQPAQQVPQNTAGSPAQQVAQAVMTAAGMLAAFGLIQSIMHPVNVAGFVGDKSDQTSNMTANIAAMLEVEINGSGAGKCDHFDATFTGRQCADAVYRFVERLTAADLGRLQLTENFDAELAREGKKMIAAPDGAKQKIAKQHSIADVSRALPSQLAGDDLDVMRRAGTKQLVIRQVNKPDEKKQLLYVLIDSSGSMGGNIGANPCGFFTRGNVASALVLALAKKAWEDGTPLYVRFFAGQPDRVLHAAKAGDKRALLDISRKVGIGDYNGGGTCIQSALDVAFQDIQRAKDTISKAEVLLVSDGCDSLAEARVKSAKKATKLHVLAIGEQSQAEGWGTLSKVADKFVPIRDATIDIKAIIDAV